MELELAEITSFKMMLQYKLQDSFNNTSFLKK